MAFRISVGDNQYEMEFTRDSIKQFESMGGTISGMQEKIYTSIDLLFYVGLMKHNPGINPNLAKKISDAALNDFGVDEVYEALVEPFMEVFTAAGEKPAGKSFLVIQKSSKTAKV